ncbi:hypothetical protein GGTG_09523 [Gaeumannomyces tritici R3-111a-1]|uniref:Uncharacterized protein n=1 Tax=Gaeumannomyces tritici (strain R3-111a-1) TaxID=644352 RepID=J3P7N2_GAET3|nr:hypothetical protein GGTG_09523 [Gaeumannomyces tritici R3-111a-1]EJT72664.1 hypothetical protein GGTG_09523 [Gaeumannomyces tritici R3-111a-1]
MGEGPPPLMERMRLYRAPSLYAPPCAASKSLLPDALLFLSRDQDVSPKGVNSVGRGGVESESESVEETAGLDLGKVVWGPVFVCMDATTLLAGLGRLGLGLEQEEQKAQSWMLQGVASKRTGPGLDPGRLYKSPRKLMRRKEQRNLDGGTSMDGYLPPSWARCSLGTVRVGLWAWCGHGQGGASLGEAFLKSHRAPGAVLGSFLGSLLGSQFGTGLCWAAAALLDCQASSLLGLAA